MRVLVQPETVLRWRRRDRWPARKLYDWSQDDHLESGGGANAITDLSNAHGARQFNVRDPRLAHDGTGSPR